MSHRGGPTPTGLGDIDRMVERWERAPHPAGLPIETAEATGQRREGPPVRVRAAIPVYYHYTDTIFADAEVIAWTDRAVLVRVVIPPSTAERKIWLWANAVRRV